MVREPNGWHFIPLPAIEEPPTSFGSPPADLLEKESHAGGQALLADLADPLEVQRAKPGSAFPTSDHPVNAVKVESEGSE